MSKQLSQSAKKRVAPVKAPAGKSAASKKPKTAVQPASTIRSKAATSTKAAQRKETKPAAKSKLATKPQARTASKPAAKTAVPKKSPPMTARTSPAPASKNAAVQASKPAAVKPAAKSAVPPVVKKTVNAIREEKSAPVPSKKSVTAAPKTPDNALNIGGATAKNEKPDQPAAVAAPYKAVSEFDGFKVNDHVVYPTHGVGKIIAVESQEIAGTSLELFVIAFDQDKMTLRVPLGKAKSVGMRILSSRDTVRTALKTLRGRARIKRTMWSRRAQEYEAKINSGDLLLIAEVVRDLHRAEGQPEQSYSERQIYESALERMAREVAAVEDLDSTAALERVGSALLKAA